MAVRYQSSRGERRSQPYSRETAICRDKLTQSKFIKVLVPRLKEEDILIGNELAPTDATLSPRHEEWLKLRSDLGVAKEKFDLIPPNDFDSLMRSVDLYTGLKQTLKHQFGMQISTNASMKMSEIIVEMGLLRRYSDTKIQAFCNAELPGAFIVALNHYLHTRYRDNNLQLDWAASSFYPGEDEDLLGDYYGIYSCNRTHWLMGPRPNALPEACPDITGDVTDPVSVEAFSHAIQSRFDGHGATLYTSDVGIGVAEDYNRQEELTSALNFGQV